MRKYQVVSTASGKVVAVHSCVGAAHRDAAARSRLFGWVFFVKAVRS